MILFACWVQSRGVVNRSRRLLSDVAGLLLEGADPFRVREVVAFRNGRGERRVSWLIHRGELEVLRGNARRGGTSVRRAGAGLVVGWVAGSGGAGGVVGGCWGLDGVCSSFAAVLPRAVGTPRSEWVEWPLPDGVADLEAGALSG